MSIGDNIRKLRKQHGYTQEYLAEVAGTTKQAIYKYETGIVTNIPTDKIEKLSALFGVSPSYLMGWEEEQPPIPDGLTEDERFWVEIYRKVSPEVQDLLITMVSSFDQQSDEARQMLLKMIRAALGGQV